MIAGIDIGTSYSNICILNKEGKAEAVKTSTGLGMYGNDYSLPSAVFIDKDKVLVGQAAYNSRMKTPENFKSEFKRDFGQEVPYHLGNQSFLPEDLYKELFVHLKVCAETYTGENLQHAYITHPARFSEDQKKKLKQAANRAGLLNISLVEEPVAAAFHYVAENNLDEDKTLLVYDFGGGTFDVALIRFRHGEFELMTAPSGIERCGGIDVDRLIYDNILQTIPSELKESVNVSAKMQQNFKSQVNEYSIKAKHHLSSAEEFHDDFQVVYDFVDYRLERAELNLLISPIVDETLHCVRTLIEKANISANDIDAVLLVGGSSRIPLVKKALAELLQKPVKENVDPDLAIAMGAAAWGKSKNLSCGYKAGQDKSGKWGFSDSTGEPVLPYIYEEARDFSENRAAVKMNGKWGVIDQSGKIITPFDFDEIFSYNQGLAKARKANKYGLLNHTGNEHTAFKYTELGEFTDNLCLAKVGNLYGFISPDGNEYIPIIYTHVDNFINGRARVKRNNKIGYINTVGKEFIPCAFDEIRDFVDGRALVKVDNRFGYIDENGKAGINIIYHSVTSFENSHYLVTIENKYGVIDNNENMIVPIQFKKVIYDPDNKQYIVEEKNQQGIYSLNGKVLKQIESKGVHNSELVEMMLVKGGAFQMGDKENIPTHHVTVSDFSIGKYPVTQKQWQIVMGNNPSCFKGENNPVEIVSWFDAVTYCNKLSEQEGLQPVYKINKNEVSLITGAIGYRLPTEAEWEFAARGGIQSKGYEYAGSNNIEEVAWYDGNSGNKLHPVGQKHPNELGLYDMSGNVYEWCQDWYGNYQHKAQINPTGIGLGTNRLLRGGSWYNIAQRCRSGSRRDFNPSSNLNYFGFRLALSMLK